ncbi:MULTISPECIES: site-specific integrase [Bacteria]|uniref:site-specific integrase n=1 Tax=Bacteria TaxID=2 RepID=UPI00186640CF|nr:site-specific integrase [Pseudoalteromonas undina]
MKHSEFKQADLWVPLLCLYAGMRVSEACQITVDSITEVNGIKVFNIDSADEHSNLKTDNAYRQIPVHSLLLDLGFLNFIAKQKSRGKKLLFSEKPDDEYGDWSKKISARFLRILNNLGMKAGNRPTIYGLRHTFIDELQQLDVNENIVAELVGHSKANITFGRYGKKLNIKLLKEKVELLPKKLINLKIIEKKFEQFPPKK